MLACLRLKPRQHPIKTLGGRCTGASQQPLT
jgi:hypothetical protein